MVLQARMSIVVFFKPVEIARVTHNTLLRALSFKMGQNFIYRLEILIVTLLTNELVFFAVSLKVLTKIFERCEVRRETLVADLELVIDFQVTLLQLFKIFQARWALSAPQAVIFTAFLADKLHAAQAALWLDRQVLAVEALDDLNLMLVQIVSIDVFHFDNYFGKQYIS